MDIKKDLVDKFLIRRSQKDKDRFISYLKSNGYNFIIEKSSFFRSMNIIFGNPQKAKYIITAHYDTPPNLFLPNIVFPLNPILSLVIGSLLAIPIVLFMILFISLIQPLYDYVYNIFSNPVVYFIAVELLSLLAAFLMVLFIYEFPVKNKNNYNDNTSGVVSILELLNELSEEDKEGVVFILFDNEEKGLLGSRFYKHKHKYEIKDQTIINIDCVGDGDNLFLAYKNIENEKIEMAVPREIKNKTVIKKSSKTFAPSDHIGYPHSIAIMMLNNSKIGMYLDKIHTNRDINLRKENIDIVKQFIKSYIRNQNAN